MTATTATATTDALGKRWEKRYDALNHVIAERDPLGNESTSTFDAAGRVLTTTSPSGFPTHHEYDGRGRLTMWRDPEGQEWRYAYDANGNILDITDALGGHYLMTYGPRNERLTERNQDAFTWTHTYDELLRLKTQADPNAITRTLTYDNGGRMTQVAFSTGRVNALTYDVNNNPTLLSRTSVGQPATSTGLDYDAMDRVITVTDTFGFQVGYEYDDASRQKKLIYPGNRPLTYTLDALVRITGMTDWDGRASVFTYDAAGRLATRTYPNGVTQTNGFDDSGRQTTLNYQRQGQPQPFIALSYAYDRNGNKTSSEEKGLLPWTPPPRQDVAAAYTSSGRLISRTDTGDSPATYTYSYDPAGNMTLSTGGGKNYALTYDEDNRTTSIQLTQTPLAPQTIQNRYDALGRRVGRQHNGTETRYILNLVGDMERILCDATSTGTLTAFYIHAPGGLLYKVDASNNLTAYHADAMANVVSLTSGTGTEIAQRAYSPYGVTPAENGIANPYKFVGSQGVMEELPGLYFMRARYYSANEEAFLSIDPIKGIGHSMAGSLFVYTKSNPVSHIDPDGRKIVVKKDKKKKTLKIKVTGALYIASGKSTKKDVSKRTKDIQRAYEKAYERKYRDYEVTDIKVQLRHITDLRKAKSSDEVIVLGSIRDKDGNPNDRTLGRNVEFRSSGIKDRGFGSNLMLIDSRISGSKFSRTTAHEFGH